MSAIRTFTLLAALLCLSLFSLGCNNHFVTASGPDFDISAQSASYFPLEQGYSTTYEISSSYGSAQSITYTVGKQVSFHTGIATEWISNNNGVKDTGYFVYTGSSLLFYESKKSAPEIILTEPLKVGTSWSRFDNSGTQITDTTVIINAQDKPLDSSNGGINLVSFPTDGSQLMIVDKIESVELSRAGYFSNVVRVANDAGNGSKNYYWYAPGVGMIKYVMGAIDPVNPQSSVRGELVYYGN